MVGDQVYHRTKNKVYVIMSVNFDDDTVTLIGDNEDASFVETPKILVLMPSQSELVQKETTPTTINVHCSSFLKYINKLINEGRENECKTLSVDWKNIRAC